jgi:hypothetical protein
MKEAFLNSDSLVIPPPEFFRASQKSHTLRCVPSAKCSFNVNAAFASAASLDFGVFTDSLYIFLIRRLFRQNQPEYLTTIYSPASR